MTSGGKCRQSDLVYGVSGIGKTTQIGEAAEYLFKETGKKTRLASCSGGGWGVLDHLVDAGIVVPTYIEEREHRFEAVDKLTKGWWPKDSNDPASPLVSPGEQEDYDNIILLAFEGVSEMADWLLSYLVEIQATQPGINFYGSGKSKAVVIDENGSKYGDSAAGMYGMVQTYMKKFVSQSRALTDRYILWTALELRVIDEGGTRAPVFGPLVVGNKRTPECPAWFNNVLHLSYGDGSKTGGERRMFLTNHIEKGVPCLAKNTAPRSHPLPESLTGDKLSMGTFYRKLDAARIAAKESIGG